MSNETTRDESPELAEAEKYLRKRGVDLAESDCAVIATELDRMRATVARLEADKDALATVLRDLMASLNVCHYCGVVLNGDDGNVWTRCEDHAYADPDDMVIGDEPWHIDREVWRARWQAAVDAVKDLPAKEGAQ